MCCFNCYFVPNTKTCQTVTTKQRTATFPANCQYAYQDTDGTIKCSECIKGTYPSAYSVAVDGTCTAISSDDQNCDAYKQLQDGSTFCIHCIDVAV